MKRFLGMGGALLVALSVAVPIGLADDGPTTGDGPKTRPAVKCARGAFAGTILRVGVDGVLVKPARSETRKPLAVRLVDETVVKKGDAVVDRSALDAGKRARFYVRVCKREERRVITAKVIVLLPDAAAGDSPGDGTDPPTTEPKPEPKPAEDACYTGEANLVVVAVTPSSITVLKPVDGGAREIKVDVTSDTVVRKSDVNVDVTAIQAGDLVHLVVVYCKSGSIRATRVIFLKSAETPA